MSKDESEPTAFHKIKLEDYVYNINRSKEEMNLITDFSEIIPLFDEERGPRLEIGTKPIKMIMNPSSDPRHEERVDNVYKSVHLNESVASRISIPNANKMNDIEYFSSFVKRREATAREIFYGAHGLGYEKPSPVQMISMIELILGRDCIVQSKSGTGKTFSFVSGISWNFDISDKTLQHIFITNTHEIASQIYDRVVTKIYPKDAKIALCIGQKKTPAGGSRTSGGFKQSVKTSELDHRGFEMRQKPKTFAEVRDEIKNAQVIVGTMGRIYDVICNRKWNNMNTLKAICVDEFDKIVTSDTRARSSASMSTEDQLAEMITNLPITTQRAFFSATVNGDALNIACDYFRPYDRVVGKEFIALLDTEDCTLEGIRQYYFVLDSNSKKDNALLDLLSMCRISQGIIFVNNKETALHVKNMLNSQRTPIASDIFHGQMSAIERRDVFERLNDNKIRLLISTDLSSRGIDIHGINIVINYDMPDELATYIHRSGRSGRYGRKGAVISFIIENSEFNEMKKVEKINECSRSSPMICITEENSYLLTQH